MAIHFREGKGSSDRSDRSTNQPSKQSSGWTGWMGSLSLREEVRWVRQVWLTYHQSRAQLRQAPPPLEKRLDGLDRSHDHCPVDTYLVLMLSNPSGPSDSTGQVGLLTDHQSRAR